jgi:hypothetical protein
MTLASLQFIFLLLNYAKKRRLLNGAAEPFSDECVVPRYSEVTAARSPIFSCVPLTNQRLFPAFDGDQPTVIIGAGRDRQLTI